MDDQGLGCARCGGAFGPRWEECYIDEETKAKLRAHAGELKTFGVTLEEYEPIRKDAGTTISTIGLALSVAESLHPGALRDLIRFLWNLAIPEEQILRLRLDEPEAISEVLHAPGPSRTMAKSTRPAAPKSSIRYKTQSRKGAH